MMEGLWSSLQSDLLNQDKWETRDEFANANGDHSENCRDCRGRYSALGCRTPFENVTFDETRILAASY